MSDNFIQENSEIITLRAMANVFMPEALDPVGQEDNDPDNDGNENDPNDKYIMKRRKAIGAAIDKRKKKLKEAASADAHTSDDDEEEIVEKKVKNKVTINPQMESKGYYDPMEDDEFDHDEAEKNRGVSGKNNPKGGKRLYKKPKRKSVEEAVNTPTSDYNRAKQLNSPASPTGGQRPPASMDPRNKPGIDPLTGVKMASAGTGPKLKPGSGLGGGKPVYPKGQEPKPTGATLPNLQTAGYEPEGDQLDEKSIQMQRRVDRYLGRDKAKAKERLKKQNERKEKKAALAAMEKQYKGMKSGIYSSYEPEGEMVDEKLNLKKADMGDVIKDFYKSDAPQFKGRSKEKRREMAIAAKLTAERGGRRLGEASTEVAMSPQELALQKRKTAIDKMITMKRQQALQKVNKQKVNEEEADRVRDERQMRGGVDGNTDYRRPPAKKATNAQLGIKPGKTAVQKELEKKHGKGKSAMDIVKAEIRAKHGKGSVK